MSETSTSNAGSLFLKAICCSVLNWVLYFQFISKIENSQDSKEIFKILYTQESPAIIRQ